MPPPDHCFRQRLAPHHIDDEADHEAEQIYRHLSLMPAADALEQLANALGDKVVPLAFAAWTEKSFGQVRLLQRFGIETALMR
jgi:hypothetical protein